MKTIQLNDPCVATDTLKDVAVGEGFFMDGETSPWYRVRQTSTRYVNRKIGATITEEQRTTHYCCVRLEDGQMNYYRADTPVRPVELKVTEVMAIEK